MAKGRGGFGGGMPGNMNQIMKQAQRMQAQMEEQQAQSLPSFPCYVSQARRVRWKDCLRLLQKPKPVPRVMNELSLQMGQQYGNIRQN